jgi:N6-L-threonylcarbamoyladenine synthase
VKLFPAPILAVETSCDETSVAIVGGVAANEALRARVLQEVNRRKCLIPPFDLCTDNAAMIGLAAAWRIGERGLGEPNLEVRATAVLAETPTQVY